MRPLQRRSLAVAMVVVGLGAQTPAHSSLIGADLFTLGDQLLTRDTDTGLDWLDLTATTGLSASDIQGDVGGWNSLGFNHATIPEVTELFLNSDPPNVILNTGLIPSSPDNIVGALLLLDLMGVTNPGPSGNEFDVLGNGILSPDAPTVFFADYGTDTAVTLGFFFVPDGMASIEFSDDKVGNYLIRASPVISPIPEPSTLALFLSGLAILGLMRRRQAGAEPLNHRPQQRRHVTLLPAQGCPQP